MDEVARFLAEHPPFDQLPPERLRSLVRQLEIEYFPAGHVILRQGGPKAAFLYIIRRGNVELLREGEHGADVIDTLGEGECFGHVSLNRNAEPLFTVRAREETLCYLLPAAAFRTLIGEEPAFASFFARSAVERLEFALRATHAEASPELFRTRLRDLVQRPLITIAPDATVRAAAELMRDHNISSLVVSGDPPGMLTDRDLRVRVLAAGRPDTTPVREVMSAPALTYPADGLVFEGLLTMLQRGIHHLPLTEAGRVIGLVTHTDILRRQIRSPLFLPRQLERATTLADLRVYAEQVTATVGALLDAGARVRDIGRVVALAHDALIQRLLRDAEQRLGAPPCAYAWLVLGSEGRYEQTLRTDQDNALVYADDAPAGAEHYFAALAERVVGDLIAIGFPRCPGEIMATNPRWRQPLRVWQGYFRSWIDVPHEQALLEAAIFFDFRQIHGALDAEAALRPLALRGREQRVFLARLARAALRHQPPVGWWQQLFAGARRDRLDIKLHGTAPVVDLARLYALEAGFGGTNTLARLRAAGGQSSLSTDDAEELAAAFEWLSLLRLRHQYAQLERNQPADNLILLHELSALERRELKDALRVVSGVQQGAAWSFQVAQLA
ncbi:DUF294 nucleotidyltransferase-like domain-containing protein [Kallotenue papyrolyticum]|uniref:DUF294 nucleotidyltransferase-like domain-containing protein n=1 Tax=Kallotenue papyrolyticum TaxID=1325125 RepID=UPI000471D758|nr:cyclic nucleotide-binding/CBS domain-containing protein [Kallotenue papyrolyticum]